MYVFILKRRTTKLMSPMKQQICFSIKTRTEKKKKIIQEKKRRKEEENHCSGSHH